jgi:glycosyltransferase involved in cell wall biosynthesis
VKKKSIYFICPDLSIGGAERVVAHLLKHLPREKYRFRLLVLMKQGRFFAELPPDVQVISLDKKRKSDLLRLLFTLAFRIFPRQKPAAVISFIDYTNLLVLAARLLAPYKPKILIRVGTNLSQDYRYKKFRYPGYARNLAIRLLYPLADKIIAVSRGTAGILQQRFHLDPGLIRVIYNGVNAEEIAGLARARTALFPGPAADCSDRHPLILLACGRLYKVKNFPLVLRACALVKAKLARQWGDRLLIRLYILGDGPEKPALEALIRQLGLDEEVHLLGAQPNPYQFFSQTDIFLFSSRYEGFPNTLLEAMACQAAVIATDCPSGPGEVITHGVDGLLVRENSVRQMAAAILKLAEQPACRKQLALAGKQRVAGFKLEYMIRAYMDVLDEQLG